MTALKWTAAALVALLAFPAHVAAAEADAIPGPINARVVSVYDGDTLTVDAAPWPGLTAHTKVRVAGVEVPAAGLVSARGDCGT